MPYALCDAAYRALVLFVIGLAPYAAPIDAAPARSPFAAALHLAIFALLAVATEVLVRKTRARDPAVALTAVLAFLAAVILAFAFGGADGPLARGAYIMTPLVWAVLASLVARTLTASSASTPSAPSSRPIRIRVFVFAGAALVAMVSLAVAHPRIAPRAHAWELALAADPGNENAVIAVASQRRGAGDRAGARDLLARCLDARASCRCAEAAASDAVDRGHYPEARAFLDRVPDCPASALHAGTWAEVLVGTNEVANGLTTADNVLESTPNEPHALYARAWALFLRGDATARAAAERAVAENRGEPAELLLGLIHYRANDMFSAKTQFEAVLRRDPDSAQALYNLALVAQRRSEYHDAREGYLRALKLDPTLYDARYNLVILTHSHGAEAEAEHHFAEFAAAVPNDPRVAQLRALLATK